MKACVLLLSGGIDSVCTAALLKSNDVKVFPLFCDYGQVAAQRELRAVHYYVNQLGLEKPRFESLNLWRRSNSRLLNEFQVDERGSYFLPLRNLQLATLGAIYADELGVSHVAFGFHASSGRQFPDTSPQFLHSVEGALSFCVDATSPLRMFQGTCSLTKAELIAQALEKNVPLEHTYSCYGADRCLSCESCRQVSSAFAALQGRFSQPILDQHNPNHTNSCYA